MLFLILSQSLKCSIMKTLFAQISNWDALTIGSCSWFMKKTKSHCLCVSHRVGVRSHHSPRRQASVLGPCREGVPCPPQEEAGSPSQESGSFCRSCCGGVCEVMEHCLVVVGAMQSIPMQRLSMVVEMSELTTTAS